RIQETMAKANQDISRSENLLIGLAAAIDDVTSAQFKQLQQDLESKYKRLAVELEAARAEYSRLNKEYYDSLNLSGENSQATLALANEVEAQYMHVLSLSKVYN